MSQATAFRTPSLVMLDCDGTLFESLAANVAYYEAVLERMGRPPLDDAGRELAHRMASPQLFAQLFRDDPASLARALEIARGVDYAPFLERMEPMPGLFETLAWLHERFKTALVTNRGATIPALVAHFELGPYFDLVVGVHDVARPKPAPDMLLHCLEHFAVRPSEAIYVGDSPGDREASRAAGVEFIAVGDSAFGDAASAAAAPRASVTGTLATGATVLDPVTAPRRVASFADLPALIGMRANQWIDVTVH